MGRPAYGLKPETASGEVFASAADAWFWTISALRARADGARGDAQSAKRPCDPDDVVRCLDRLYRNRQIDLRHARVLRVWGERQRAPDPGLASAADHHLWLEAIQNLSETLRSKGLVAEQENNP